MHNLTRYQQSNQEMIRQWLKSPFPERARLRPQDILLTYQPGAIDWRAKFFTPLVTANYVVQNYLPEGHDFTLLEPAAGIGHLLWPLRNREPHPITVCCEID